MTPENQDSKNMLPVVQSWAAGGLAETLYSQLNSPAARLAMLLGLARHKQYMRAMQVKSFLKAFDIYLDRFNSNMVDLAV